MGKAIRKRWERNAIETLLLGGLFLVPLVIHTLARILT
jgi:hypothetical protein